MEEDLVFEDQDKTLHGEEVRAFLPGPAQPAQLPEMTKAEREAETKKQRAARREAAAKAAKKAAIFAGKAAATTGKATIVALSTTGRVTKKGLSKGAVATIDNGDAWLEVLDRGLFALLLECLRRGEWAISSLIFIVLALAYRKKIRIEKTGPIISFLKKDTKEVTQKVRSFFVDIGTTFKRP